MVHPLNSDEPPHYFFMNETLQKLIKLSHEIGREERRLAILGEGNTSASLGDGTFLIKASGSSLSTIDEKGITHVHSEPVLAALDDSSADDTAETFLHAVCINEAGAKWVGHCHAESVLSIVCSQHGAKPFLQHMFPDAIVVCGREVAVVPYLDPGLALAREFRKALRDHKARYGSFPKVVLMENHGPVALGASDTEVLNILLMLDKWARILVGTLSVGGPRFLPSEVSDRIDNRPDEHYRRKQIAEAQQQ